MAKIKAEEEGERVKGTQDNDKITGLAGDETLLGRGGKDKIFGDKGDDVLRGGDDKDKLFGDKGNDRLFGEEGNDKLDGGKGNDILVGGEGRDKLTGDKGSDTFEITDLDSADKITDYVRNVDSLNLRPLLPDFGQSGDDLADFVSVTPTPTQTLIAVDQSGTGTGFVQVARLLRVSSFDDPTPGDFGLPLPGTPVLANPIPDQSASEGVDFNFRVPANAFSDPDGDTLSYSFQLADGGNLPNWLSGDQSGLLTGEPGKFDAATHNIRVTASDGRASDHDIFTLNVTTEPASGRSRSSPAGNTSDDSRSSFSPAISADGRFVAFETQRNIDPDEDDPGRPIIFHEIRIHDAFDGETVNVSPEDDVRAADPTISATGRFVAYETFTQEFFGDEPIPLDVRLVDLTAPGEVLVSTDDQGRAADGASSDPAISGDGRFVAFQSDARNLSDDDIGEVTDVFLKDMSTGIVMLISAGEDGDGGDGASTNPVISQDGRYIAFQSEVEDLVSGDANDLSDIFVKDSATGDIVRFEAPDGLAAANADISGDGRFVVFESLSDNGPERVWLADTSNPGSEPVRIARLEGGDVFNFFTSSSPTVSADGSLVSYIAPNEEAGRLELLVQELTGSGDLRSDAKEVVLATDIRQSVISDDGTFAAFVSSDTFGDGLENGNGDAVFSTPTTTGRLVSELIVVDTAALELAEVVDTDSADVGALLDPASGEDVPASQDDSAASSTVDGGSSTMSMDQVLVAPQDEVLA